MGRYIFIMAGGRGERFWPQSRLKRPKHLLTIVGDTPMLCQTIDRVARMVAEENIFVITNIEQVAQVRELCPQLGAQQIIAETEGRDTAAAVALALSIVKSKDPEGCFAVLPADHVIESRERFRQVLSAAFAVAEQQSVLVTIGIKPTMPATGYGYIRRGGAIAQVQDHTIYQVQAFVEKPDCPTADKYLRAGDYYWNAGMFVWSVAALEGAFAKHSPQHHRLTHHLVAGLRAGQSLSVLLKMYYPQLEKVSIDYAVMEKAAEVVMMESNFDWDDVGEWPAVARHYAKDAAGNSVRGQVVIEDGRGNIALNEDGHTTVLIGVNDLIVVQTTDATLVCPRARAQEIKAVVKKLASDSRTKVLV